MSTMQNQHPGLTPEQDNWLTGSETPRREAIIRDLAARLHRLEQSSRPTTAEARPEWWHKLNAASPEIAARAARAISEQEDGEWSPFLVTSFYWRHTSEGREWWYEVDRFLNGLRPDLPPLPVENEPIAKADASGKLEFADTRDGWKALAAVSREQLREQEDELARLRAEVERLTKERDEARETVRELQGKVSFSTHAHFAAQLKEAELRGEERGLHRGRQEAREGIAELMDMQAEHYRRNAADPAMLRKEFNEFAHDFCRAIARNARNWQPAQEGGAK